MVKNNNLSHAYIFFGENGIGKSIVAEEFGKKILHVDKENPIDLIKWKISSNKKSIGVDEIRNLIIDINKKPYEENKKIIIVYNCEKMTIQAQNAFLKTIEEPPSETYIIMLCQDISSLLDTIISRCQIYKFNRLNENDMHKYINKKYYDLDDHKYKVVSAFSEGIPGKADLLVTSTEFNEFRDSIIEILAKLYNSDFDLISSGKTLNKYENYYGEIFTCFISYIRDIMIYKEIGKNNLIINIDKLSYIKQLASSMSFAKLMRSIDIINDSNEKLRRNVNTEINFDVMLMKLQEV